MKDMLTQVLQGAPVQQAASTADGLITERMSS
jgi:hypothetical protein